MLLTDSYSNWPCSLRWLQLTLSCELEISYSWMTSLQLMQDTPLFFIKWDRVKVKESEHVIRRWVWMLWFYIGSYTCQPIFPYPLITTSPASLPLIFFREFPLDFRKQISDHVVIVKKWQVPHALAAPLTTTLATGLCFNHFVSRVVWRVWWWVGWGQIGTNKNKQQSIPGPRPRPHIFLGGIWQMANKLPAGSLEFCQTTIFRNLSPSFWSIAIEALDFGLL